MTHRYDLVIRGGMIADGTGAALREADVAVAGGKIVAVGTVAGSGREEIDARGPSGDAGLCRHPYAL